MMPKTQANLNKEMLKKDNLSVYATAYLVRCVSNQQLINKVLIKFA
jgi:hypothetical protein